MADQISDAVLDALLGEDPQSRVACETMITTGLCVVAGEITTTGYVDIPDIVRQTIREIGYDREDYGFDGSTCGVMVTIDSQSDDIRRGVDHSEEVRSGFSGEQDDLDRQGAGDQGMMFGYACDETDALMPLPIHLAHRMAQRHAEIRRAGTIPYLRPDGKTQITFDYEDDRPVRLRTVLVSTQHSDGIDRDTMIRNDLIVHVIRPVIPEQFVDELTSAGWLAALIQAQYGGSGLTVTEASVILEEINRSGGNAAACHAQMYIMGALLRHGNDEQKKRYLPSIAAGKLRLQAFGVTEPDAGSDTTHIRTNARREGDHYIVTVSYTHLTLPTNREV